MYCTIYLKLFFRLKQITFSGLKRPKGPELAVSKVLFLKENCPKIERKMNAMYHIQYQCPICMRYTVTSRSRFG